MALPARPSALEKLRSRLEKLPDPTHLFLIHVAVILGLHAVRADLLRTWVARLLLPPGLLLSVFATALWRRPVARHRTPNAGAVPTPPGVVADAAKLVRTGIALRQSDGKVAQAESDLRRGQLRLEMLRKEIECRLPNAASSAERNAAAAAAAAAAAPQPTPQPFDTAAGLRSLSAERYDSVPRLSGNGGKSTTYS